MFTIMFIMVIAIIIITIKYKLYLSCPRFKPPIAC